ncbi:unnamed protein product [Aphanomyces euteiches]
MSTTAVSWRRFIHIYYGLNTLLVLSYGLARFYYSSEMLLKKDDWLNTTRVEFHQGLTAHGWLEQEQQIIGMLVGVVLMNYRKKATVDGIVAMVFMYAKCAVGGLFYMLDGKLFAAFVAANLVIFVAVPFPKYNGPHKLVKLTPEIFKHALRTDKSAKWLVYFFADWCDECLYHDAMFAALSLKYANDKVHFGRMDVQRHSDIAAEYSIDTSALTTKQLPSLILFEHGKEVKRLPRMDHSGKVVRTILDEDGVATYFGFKELPPKAK